MAKNGIAEQVTNLLSEYIVTNQDAPISAAWMANYVQQKIDPEDASPPPIRWASLRHLTAMAGRMLARQYEPTVSIDSGPSQMELFPGVQPRYPAVRDGESVYVPREQMSFEERELVRARMAKASQSWSIHVAAYNAWHRDKTQQENEAQELAADAQHSSSETTLPILVEYPPLHGKDRASEFSLVG